MQKRILKSFIGVAAAATLTMTMLAGAGCSTTKSSGDQRTAGQKLDDKKITKTVMEALNNEPVYKFANVKVNAYKGVVQLSGFVDTPEQKQRAAEVAKNIERTHEVVNDI